MSAPEHRTGTFGAGTAAVGEAGDGQKDWREEAVDAALWAEALAGDGFKAVLHRIRLNLPDRSTLTVDRLDPPRLEAFLRVGRRGLRGLLSGSHRTHDFRGRNIAAFSWHALSWEGEEIEVVAPPGMPGKIVVVGRSLGTLRSFAAALKDHCEGPEGRALAFSAGAWASDPELDAEIAKVSWEDVVLPEEQVREIRRATEAFFARREAYRSLSFAWRRGILLVGPPGTGKTMVCKAVVAALPDKPFLYVRDLSGNGPQEGRIREVFRRACRLAPCVLVMEDVDGFVDDRNRAVFLGELDGFEDNDGMLVLASSNHPERVDEALLKRPSRFDRVFKIGLPAEAERRAYCSRLVRHAGLPRDDPASLDAGTLCSEVARRTGGFTPAHIKEAIASAALELAHEGNAAANGAFARGVLSYVESLRKQISETRSPEDLADARRSPEFRPGFRPREASG